MTTDDDAALRAEPRRISAERPRWGYGRAHARLRELGWGVNRKRVQRLWREEGLRVPARRRKRQRLGDCTVPADRLRAERSGHVWALDFQFDQTADGRVLKLLHVVDEFTREALEILVARRIDADTTVAVLERLIAERSAPEQMRCDNGPELTGHALRDWCRFASTETAFIEPGSPWQNPYVESFGARIRDELLDVEQFASLAEAQVVIGDWRFDLNHRRPHSAAPGRVARGRARRAQAQAAPGAAPRRRRADQGGRPMRAAVWSGRNTMPVRTPTRNAGIAEKLFGRAAVQSGRAWEPCSGPRGPGTDRDPVQRPRV